MATGLRAIVRQDPEVIMVGEIRDLETATVALQAALTGQLVLSSFHAGSAAGAISRLLDMGIEPYILQSGLLAVISQRLVRRLCQCAKSPDLPSNCAVCSGSGFHGRLVLAEILRPQDPVLHEAILQRVDANTLARRAIENGMIDLATQAKTAIEAGLTTEAEVRRVLGSH
jgi:type II secretory ATPase GspE/PulE/Tfp pilus assembly ATPase PilB-like protein